MVVVGLDFGTSRSALAIGARGEITVFTPTSASLRSHDSRKVETAVLLDATGKAVKFGIPAKKHYIEHPEYELFEWFKMNLNELEDSESPFEITDVGGRPRDLLTVITQALKFLTDEVIKNLSSRHTDLQKSDIFWVVTVPVIWSSAATTVMRRACVAAKMTTSEWGPNIRFVNEAEAAAHDVVGSNLVQPSVGQTFVVLDCGGGTTDLAFLEICGLQPVQVREIVRAEGSTAGATRIDKQFIALLSLIFGRNRFEKMKRTTGFAELMLTFEDVKLQFQDSHIDNKKFKLLQFIQDYNEVNPNDAYNPAAFESDAKAAIAHHPQLANIGVVVNKHSLTIPHALLRTWFDDVIKDIVDLLSRTLSHSALSNVSFVYFVGGFSQSDYVFSRVREVTLQRNIELIRPEQADVAIVRGAVRAQLDEAVVSRRARFHYGTTTHKKYDSAKHDPSQIKVIRKNQMVEIFDVLVRQGQELETNHITTPKSYYSLSLDQPRATFPLLFLDHDIGTEEIIYANDPRLETMYRVSVSLPSNGSKEQRTVNCQIQFRGVPELVLTHGTGDPVQSTVVGQGNRRHRT